MKRKNFLFTFASSLALTNGLLSCSRQSNEEVVTWKMATTWDTKLLPTIYGGAEEICKTVENLTAGKFKIEIQHQAQGTKHNQLFEGVKNQRIDCGHTASFYYGKEDTALYFASSIPFGLTPQQHNAWIYEGGGIGLIRDVYSKFNIINFPAGNTGSQMGGWFKKEIKELSDLKGLKMRIPGLGAKVMQELGVESKPLIIPSEIYSELEKGNINAAEFIGPHDDLQLGLDKVTKFYYYPGWWEPSTALDLLVNKESWNKLKPEYQQVLEIACMKVNLTMLAKYDVLNAKAMGKIYTDDPEGLKVKVFPSEILLEALDITRAEITKLSGESLSFKKVKEHWMNFNRIQDNWKEISQVSDSLIQDDPQ